MQHACTAILVGVASLVLEMKLAYGPNVVVEKLIDRNRLKKFMQVGIDVTCMHTSFGGRGLFSFGDMATF